jgi:RNA polymerase sigma factor (sigma-70 family)
MNDFTERTDRLFKLMKEDPDKALLYRNEIVELNLRLVSHVLKQYRPYTDDQYQAGCMGLIIAVDTFKHVQSDKYDKPVPFASFACFCIRREIHKQFRYQQQRIENVFANNMVYLDAPKLYKDNGEVITIGDTIVDEMSEEELDKILDENDLTNFFNNIIMDSIYAIANKTKGQNTKFDKDKWISLEIRYLLELADIDSQKDRFNLSQMARTLGVSVQNIRVRHSRVLGTIRQKCKERGYKIEED